MNGLNFRLHNVYFNSRYVQIPWFYFIFKSSAIGWCMCVCCQISVELSRGWEPTRTYQFLRLLSTANHVRSPVETGHSRCITMTLVVLQMAGLHPNFCYSAVGTRWAFMCKLQKATSIPTILYWTDADVVRSKDIQPELVPGPILGSTCDASVTQLHSGNGDGSSGNGKLTYFALGMKSKKQDVKTVWFLEQDTNISPTCSTFLYLCHLWVPYVRFLCHSPW